MNSLYANPLLQAAVESAQRIIDQDSSDPHSVEELDRLINGINTEVSRYDAIDVIADQIQTSGMISTHDVHRLEKVSPGIITNHMSTDDFTFAPSVNGFEGAVEAINWAKIGKWGIIGAIIAAVVALIFKLLKANVQASDEASKKIDELESYNRKIQTQMLKENNDLNVKMSQVESENLKMKRKIAEQQEKEEDERREREKVQAKKDALERMDREIRVKRQQYMAKVTSDSIAKMVVGRLGADNPSLNHNLSDKSKATDRIGLLVKESCKIEETGVALSFDNGSDEFLDLFMFMFMSNDSKSKMTSLFSDDNINKLNGKLKPVIEKVAGDFDQRFVSNLAKSSELIIGYAEYFKQNKDKFGNGEGIANLKSTFQKLHSDLSRLFPNAKIEGWNIVGLSFIDISLIKSGVDPESISKMFDFDGSKVTPPKNIFSLYKTKVSPVSEILSDISETWKATSSKLAGKEGPQKVAIEMQNCLNSVSAMTDEKSQGFYFTLKEIDDDDDDPKASRNRGGWSEDQKEIRSAIFGLRNLLMVFMGAARNGAKDAFDYLKVIEDITRLKREVDRDFDEASGHYKRIMGTVHEQVTLVNQGLQKIS